LSVACLTPFLPDFLSTVLKFGLPLAIALYLSITFFERCQTLLYF
jgi:hypothetical protein